MNLWRLEWARLVRTRRLLALGVAFVFFGMISPLLARYRDELVGNVGGGITIIAPPAVPADGMVNYSSNSAQIGLLVFAFVAAGALAFDANRETAIFLRTRVRRARDLVLVKYAVTVLVGVAAFDVGALLTWVGSVLLIGPLPVGGVIAGVLLADLYLAFFAALVAVFAARSSSVVSAAVMALAVALLLGLLGVVAAVGEWLPSRLVGALPDLSAGASVSEYVRSATVAAALTVALLGAATWIANRREM